jgi:acetyltransferase-like isoleucine patch superfamily enzyme
MLREELVRENHGEFLLERDEDAERREGVPAFDPVEVCAPIDVRGSDEAPPSSRPRPPIVGLLEEIGEFVGGFEARRLAWSMTRWVRAFSLSRARARLLSIVGCDIGPGTAITGYVYIIGPRGCAERLHVGSGCIFGPDVTLCLDAPITLGKNVSIGPRAVLYTATHPLGVASRRMQLDILARPIVVEDGAWVGLAAMILPGVRIGRGAVVSAGAVVNEDVPANVLVAGNPATVVRDLPSR